MHYQEAIKEIQKHGLTKVLVTGPHRSGTTITGKILACELGYRYVDELDIGFDQFSKVCDLYANHDRFVLQAPTLSFCCSFFPGAIVFMMRPIDEILRSQKRIGFTGPRDLKKYFRDDGDIARIKYDAWDRFQKDLMRPGEQYPFEVDYHSIKDHSLYVPDELRTSFTVKQTVVSDSSVS